MDKNNEKFTQWLDSISNMIPNEKAPILIMSNKYHVIQTDMVPVGIIVVKNDMEFSKLNIDEIWILL